MLAQARPQRPTARTTEKIYWLLRLMGISIVCAKHIPSILSRQPPGQVQIAILASDGTSLTPTASSTAQTNRSSIL